MSEKWEELRKDAANLRETRRINETSGEFAKRAADEGIGLALADGIVRSLVAISPAEADSKDVARAGNMWQCLRGNRMSLPKLLCSCCVAIFICVGGCAEHASLTTSQELRSCASYAPAMILVKAIAVHLDESNPDLFVLSSVQLGDSPLISVIDVNAARTLNTQHMDNRGGRSFELPRPLGANADETISTLRSLLAKLPRTLHRVPCGDLVIVSFRDANGQWITRTYSRRAPPSAIVEALKLLGVEKSWTSFAGWDRASPR